VIGYTVPSTRDVYELEADACDLALTLGLLDTLPRWHFIRRGGLRLKARALTDRIRANLLRTDFPHRAPSAGEGLSRTARD
jgi:hypothetical protein